MGDIQIRFNTNERFELCINGGTENPRNPCEFSIDTTGKIAIGANLDKKSLVMENLSKGKNVSWGDLSGVMFDAFSEKPSSPLVPNLHVDRSVNSFKNQQKIKTDDNNNQQNE